MKGNNRISALKPMIIALLALLSVLAFSCRKTEIVQPESLVSESTLEKVKQRGKLTVITEYNSTSYFLYRGTPMGFNYELLRAFADHLGVQLNIKLNHGLANTYAYLEDGNTDLVAIELPAAQERDFKFYYTDPIYYSQAVLVQRKATTGELVRDAGQLNGKTIHVEQGSPFIQMLAMLSIESGGNIRIVEHPEEKVEQLITAVASGQIDYTLANEPVAVINQKYHSNLDVKTPVGSGQNLVWMVNREGEDLLVVFNDWLSKYKRSRKFSILFEKYFYGERSVKIRGSEMYSVRGGKVSPYDAHIRKYSHRLNWDWRLLASLIYKESRFHPEAQAWSGAYGLMQLMPDVAEMYGVDSLSLPEKQIEAGVKYLASLDKQFKPLVKDTDERIKFVLASYNVGLGHVLDARRLAEKYGRNKDVWTHNVDSFLLRKSDSRFYQDPVAYYGYCRGQEPFTFVRDVMEVYQLYRNAIRN